ncbi:hypothetical protein Hypma_006058, partial [Hypsizygus marmoreus]
MVATLCVPTLRLTDARSLALRSRTSSGSHLCCTCHDFRPTRRCLRCRPTLEQEERCLEKCGSPGGLGDKDMVVACSTSVISLPPSTSFRLTPFHLLPFSIREHKLQHNLRSCRIFSTSLRLGPHLLPRPFLFDPFNPQPERLSTPTPMRLRSSALASFPDSCPVPTPPPHSSSSVVLHSRIYPCPWCSIRSSWLYPDFQILFIHVVHQVSYLLYPPAQAADGVWNPWLWWHMSRHICIWTL